MKKYIKTIVYIFIILIVVVVAYVTIKTIINNNRRTYDTYSVKKEVGVVTSTDAKYIVGSKVLARYTRDGISAYNGNATEVWNVSYEMSNPVAALCNVYAAVADKGSNKLYIINDKGSFTKVETEYPISNVAVAKGGTTAVWMDGGTKDYITLYKQDGTVISEMMTTVTESGIPLAMALSSDGTKLVTSYTVYSEGHLENHLSFYNFSEYGANYVDRLVGYKSYDDRLVCDLKFVNNEKLVAFSNKGADFFSIDVTEEEKQSIKIDETIEKVYATGKFVGFVLKNDQGKNHVKVYDTNGKQKLSFDLEESYKHFLISGEEVILYNSDSLTIKRIGANDKAHISFDMDVTALLPGGDTKYLLLGENAIQSIILGQTEKKKK